MYTESEIREALTPDNLLKVVGHFFAKYCVEEDVHEDRKSELNPRHFVKWLEQYNHDVTRDDCDALAAKLQVPPLVVNYVISLPRQSNGDERIKGFWPYLVLANRPHRHGITSVSLHAVVLWDDGTVADLSQYAHKDVTDGALRDDTVAAMIGIYAPQLEKQVTQLGLDQLHDKQKSAGCILTQEAIAKLDQLVEQTRPGTVVLIDDVAARMRFLVRYLQATFPASIPVHLRRPDRRYPQRPATTLAEAPQPPAATQDAPQAPPADVPPAAKPVMSERFDAGENAGENASGEDLHPPTNGGWSIPQDPGPSRPAA